MRLVNGPGVDGSGANGPRVPGAGQNGRAETAPPPIPLADLEILEELGRGAQTVVYRARRRGIDYALKVLRRSASGDGTALAAFRREAAMLTSVAHPGLTRIHEVGQADDRPYLVMELLDGRTLADLLDEGPLEETRAAAVAADVAAALAAAHRVGLVHRDVKPGNIMILPNGRAKVIDFGLATRAATRATDQIDPAHHVAGTFAYTAPEQAGTLRRLVDGRSDLYALGVVLFRCLTGRLPFVSADLGELMRQHAVIAAPDVRELRPRLSADIAAVVARLLAKDPDDRYQTGDELVADLDRLLPPDDAPTRRPTRPDAELIGRQSELAALLARWHTARAGTGGLALVCGLPGAGKSRLVRELVATAADGGALVLRGKCQPDEPVPLAPLRMVVDQYLRELGRLPEPARTEATDRVRTAAGRLGSLLRSLSPALAALVGGPELVTEDREEQFAVAVATFLAELARACGSAVLHLDDVQWLDAASRRVLRHLAYDLPQVPLLVAATARDDKASGAALAEFERDFADALGTRIDLEPLDDRAIARLVAATLGGAVVTPELTVQIVARSGGNPFTAGEYLHAIVDAGLIRPSWGVWVLEEGGLDRLELPDDVLDVVIARVNDLGGQTHGLLAAAAAMGLRFTAERLAQVCGVDGLRALEVVGIAVERRLIGTDEGGYVFLHDRIREALLAEVDAADLRALHQRVATVLDAIGSAKPEDTYAIARHYMLGDVENAPGAVFRACFAAGRLALAQYAAEEAVAYLESAATVAETPGFPPDVECGADFLGILGLALLRAGHFTLARRRLEQALAAESAPLRRAALWRHLCEVHHTGVEIDESIAAGRRGLAELGRPLPENPFRLVVSTIWQFLAYLAVKWSGLGAGTATGTQADRFRLESTLLTSVQQPAALGRRLALMSSLVFRTAYPGIRLGRSSPEYIRAQVNLGGVMWLAGWRRASERMVARARAAAERLGDPGLLGFIDWLPEVTRVGSGRPDPDGLRRLGSRTGRWLSASEYLASTSALCHYLVAAGHANEACDWWQRGRQRVSMDHPMLGNAFAVNATSGLAMVGRDAEAREQLRLVRGFLADRTDTWEPWVQYVMAAIHTALELGDPFDDAVADMSRLGITKARTWPTQRFLWVHLAYGRLAQCQAAPATERAGRLASARRAVDRVGRLGRRPVYGAHHRVLAAMYRELAGEPAAALRLLQRAEDLARGLDAPVLGYEIARVRARALRRLGHGADALRQAALAGMIAAEHGWEHRARWIRAEFGTDEHARAGLASGPFASTVTQERTMRRMDALQQVGLAAATVLDPHQLARVALDETIRVFGAERAFLFLVDEEQDRLVPHIGRDDAGQDIDAFAGYGATLVERVRDGADALVVTGDQDSWWVPSESAVVHGLRSIMVAPLRLKDRLLGVVYLDSRVARGIFTDDDVDVLVAITNHVAVSLETARAAQLEVAVHAARQQRDLAETLRSAMSEISSTLDPDEVLDRLLTAVHRALGADAACVVRHDGPLLTVAAVAGAAPLAAIGRRVDPDADAALAAAITNPAPHKGGAAPAERCGPHDNGARAGLLVAPAPLPDVLPGTRSWVAVPLSTRDGIVGYVLATSGDPDRYTDAHVDIVATLAGQAAAAYDNAVLYDRVRQLATEDVLTGVYTRRHALELAGRDFADAVTAGAPLAAIMVDIDHFKAINDTHGHIVGDQVIAEVAARLQAVVRPHDLLGRYGGEEFVLVLAASRASADEVAERLRTVVNSTPVSTNAGRVPVTVSVGIAYLRATDRDLSTLLGRADRALYTAKEQGRNRVAAS